MRWLIDYYHYHYYYYYYCHYHHDYYRPILSQNQECQSIEGKQWFNINKQQPN